MPATPRHCYCKEGQSHCGVCQVCGAPGHTRHHPAAMPYTGEWCDRCHDRLRRRAAARLLAIGVVVSGLLYFAAQHVK